MNSLNKVKSESALGAFEIFGELEIPEAYLTIDPIIHLRVLVLFRVAAVGFAPFCLTPASDV